ncbi:fasciclin domain-containing protein [Mucilaginibacter sp.]
MKKLAFFIFLVLVGLKVNAQSVTDSVWVSPKKELTKFAKAVNALGQKNIFNGQLITIFAPDNEAFDKLPASKIDSLLMPTNKAILTTLLNSHIIQGKLTSVDIAKAIHNGGGQAAFTTLAGTKLVAKINPNRNIILIDENGGQSIIKTFNISQGNIEVFIIDSVFLPKI